MYSNSGRAPQDDSIHRPIVKNNATLTAPATMFVSKNPQVTTFHSFDCPTVAIGNNAKLLTSAFPIPGALATSVVTQRSAKIARVIRGGAETGTDPLLPEADAVDGSVETTSGLPFSIFFATLSVDEPALETSDAAEETYLYLRIHFVLQIPGPGQSSDRLQMNRMVWIGET